MADTKKIPHPVGKPNTTFPEAPRVRQEGTPIHKAKGKAAK